MVKKPSGIDERLEQLRPPIFRGQPNTASERYLARLAEKSFLNLWSYVSPYRAQKQNGKGDGKELCDLLVVCGNNVIIFSEKTVAWSNGDLATAWCRWAKKGIRNSAAQIRGAERWILDYPERVFVDRECKVAFPITFPGRNECKIHRVVVANGAIKVCREYFGGGLGSLVIKPSIHGDKHWQNEDGNVQPFYVGDIDQHGPFVHVFNESALDIVLHELDTVTDFTEYLAKKEAFVRSGKLLEAHGEENLVAYYAINVNDEGDHDFVVEQSDIPISIDRSRYEQFTIDPRYIARRRADEISYLWDKLIESFTIHMLGGTSVTPAGFNFDLRESELGVRFMALAPRFVRRSHGEAIAGALQKSRETDRFFRTMMSREAAKDSETAFFIQTMKYQDWMEGEGGYEQYRRVRMNSSIIYARGLLERFSYLKRVVGISREALGQEHGVSGDLLYAEQANWTDAQRTDIKNDCARTGLLQNISMRNWDGKEFPDVEVIEIDRPDRRPQHFGLNRHQRRALNAGKRKK